MSRCGPLWRRPSVKAIQQRDIGMIHHGVLTATPDREKLSTKKNFFWLIGNCHRVLTETRAFDV